MAMQSIMYRPTCHVRLGILCTLLILTAILSGCSTTRVGLSPSGGANTKVASDPAYNPANLRAYSIKGRKYHPKIPRKGYEQTGIATWYGYESPNRTTANGEPFNTDILTAAHKTFPLPSIVEVTNLSNGKSVRVRVNDRGPFVGDRIIDLSRGAAKEIGVFESGTARVRVKWLGPAEPFDRRSMIAAPAPSPRRDNGAGSYIVQVGAFSQRDNAESQRSAISDAKLKRQGQLYIVYTGPFNSPARAEQGRQLAISEGAYDAVVRRD